MVLLNLLAKYDILFKGLYYFDDFNQNLMKRDIH
jgi:hypothetical protein